MLVVASLVAQPVGATDPAGPTTTSMVGSSSTVPKPSSSPPLEQGPGDSRPNDEAPVDDADGPPNRWDTPSPSEMLAGASPGDSGSGLAGLVVGDHATEYADAVRNTPGVAGYWRLHGASDLSDQASGDHDGVLVVNDGDPSAMFESAVGGGVWPGSDALEVDRGGSEQLTGRIEVGSGWFGQAAWSAEGWVRNAPDASGRFSLFEEFTDTAGRALGESDYSGRQATARRSPWAPGSYGAEVSAPVSSGAWHQVAVTDDGSTLTLFVDGRPVRSQDGGVPASFSGAAIAIAVSGGCDCWPGSVFVSDVSVYSRALTEPPWV